MMLLLVLLPLFVGSSAHGWTDYRDWFQYGNVKEPISYTNSGEDDSIWKQLRIPKEEQKDVNRDIYDGQYRIGDKQEKGVNRDIYGGQYGISDKQEKEINRDVYDGQYRIGDKQEKEINRDVYDGQYRIGDKQEKEINRDVYDGQYQIGDKQEKEINRDIYGGQYGISDKQEKEINRDVYDGQYEIEEKKEKDKNKYVNDRQYGIGDKQEKDINRDVYGGQYRINDKQEKDKSKGYDTDYKTEQLYEKGPEDRYKDERKVPSKERALYVAYVANERDHDDDEYRSRNFGKKYEDLLKVLKPDHSEDKHIIRPCKLGDRACVSKFLSENSKCAIKNNRAPDPLILQRSTLYIPHVNLSMVLLDARVTGLKTIKISEFYVNKKTGNAVLALSFSRLKYAAPATLYRFRRLAQEPVVVRAPASIEFDSGTFTAVIPKVPDLRLDRAEIHLYIDNDNPTLIQGHEITHSKDPVVRAAIAKFTNKISTTIQESLLFQSQLLGAAYVQETLCDFGLKIISV